MDTPVRVKEAVVGIIVVAALVVAGVFAHDLGYLDATSFQISEVEVQSTTRECLVGDFIAPARTPFGEVARTPMFICGENLLYESDPGDAVILNDYFEEFQDFQE
ncbi:hypothetical protein LCGC14_1403770 [marine sediment metagenome]|uniref:Uncharacterized protein n=1 Tax=marine sediment metagenome TaxID=412755 RepID=A0A0F9KH85_9ZZZZ